MTKAMPLQSFRIGQRVQPLDRSAAFEIQQIYFQTGTMYYGTLMRNYPGSELSPLPDYPPYEPTERQVVAVRGRPAGTFAMEYRCETDAEMTARHAAERAAHDGRLAL